MKRIKAWRLEQGVKEEAGFFDRALYSMPRAIGLNWKIAYTRV